MIVIGAGRVGTSLKKRSESVGIDVQVIGRSDDDAPLHGPVGDPIVVATRNDDLVDVIRRVPMHRREDLVFIQNGVVRTLLNEHQLGRTTRGLIYFAATERDGEIQPGQTSWFHGVHGHTMARWFGMMDLTAQNVDWARFGYYEFEKLTWLCAFGVLCDAHDCSVGTAMNDHHDDLKTLVSEMSSYGRMVLNVDAPLDYLLGRVEAYTATIPEYRASVKEWEWRNGAVWTAMTSRGRALPRMGELLEQGGHPLPSAR